MGFGMMMPVIFLDLSFVLTIAFVIGVMVAMSGLLFLDAVKADPAYTGVYCPNCEYDLRSAVHRDDPKCPECGELVPSHAGDISLVNNGRPDR